MSHLLSRGRDIDTVTAFLSVPTSELQLRLQLAKGHGVPASASFLPCLLEAGDPIPLLSENPCSLGFLRHHSASKTSIRASLNRQAPCSRIWTEKQLNF